jgi:hypothetical protein
MALKPDLNLGETTYIQQPSGPYVPKDVLIDTNTYNAKQVAILQNIINARMYKTEKVDPEHNMLIAFDEGIQNRFLEKEDVHYIESVSNYPTYLKQVKVAELTNINMVGDLVPLNKDTLVVLKDLNRALGVVYASVGVEAKAKEAGEDMVLLGDGYTTYYRTDSPVSLDDNFRDKKILSNNNSQVGGRTIDARRILLDPVALSIHGGEFCSEEGRVTLNYVRQVITKYFGSDKEKVKVIYENVRGLGQPPGDRDFKTAEFLENDGRYTSTQNMVLLYIYYEKRYDGESNSVVVDRYYIANDQIIGYDSNVGTRFPYANWKAFKRRDTPYSQSYISKILPIQKVIDQIDAITLTIGLQTATPSMVINDVILGDYTDAEIQEIFVAGNIFRGRFPAGGANEISKNFISAEIPAQLLALRDRLEQDQLKILNITPISQGNTGSLQKTGAVKEAVAETKKVDRFSIDTSGVDYFKQVHYMLMELIIDVISEGKEDIVIPDITEDSGYSVLSLEAADVTNLAYDFKFNLDLSAKDKQANDEAILQELLQIDLQYNSDDTVRMILPEEVLKASSLSSSIKNDILQRIEEDREQADKLIKEQQEQQAAAQRQAEQQANGQQIQQQQQVQGQAQQQQQQQIQEQQIIQLQQQQQQPQPAQAAQDIIPQGGALPPELLALLGGGGASPIDSLLAGGGGQQPIAPQSGMNPAIIEELLQNFISQNSGLAI